MPADRSTTDDSLTDDRRHPTGILTQRGRRSTRFRTRPSLVNYDSSPEPNQTHSRSQSSSPEQQHHRTELDVIDELTRSEERWKEVWEQSLRDPEPTHQQLHRDMVLAENLQDFRKTMEVTKRYRKKLSNYLHALNGNLQHLDGLVDQLQAKIVYRLHLGNIMDIAKPEDGPLPIPNSESAHSPENPRQEDTIWRCAICHNLNPPERWLCRYCKGECQTCGRISHRDGTCKLPMGPQLIFDDSWRCSRCKYKNPTDLDECERCLDTCRTCHQTSHAEEYCPQRPENPPNDRDYRTATEDELLELGIKDVMVQDVITALEQEEEPLDKEGLLWLAERIFQIGIHKDLYEAN